MCRDIYHCGKGAVDENSENRPSEASSECPQPPNSQSLRTKPQISQRFFSVQSLSLAKSQSVITKLPKNTKLGVYIYICYIYMIIYVYDTHICVYIVAHQTTVNFRILNQTPRVVTFLRNPGSFWTSASSAASTTA